MKLIQFVYLALITIILASCNPYRKITFSNKEFYKKKRVSENIDKYDVIVHDDESTYKLNEAQLENNELSGTLEKIDENASIIDRQSGTFDEDIKNDIHVYLDSESNVDEISSGEKVTLSESQVREAEMYAKDNDGIAGVFLTILIVVGVLILVGILILVAAISSAGSTSGGSNSGGSDSGGSSCYVATMAYGSQDAKQVVLLRQFRDRFLTKFNLGRAFITWYYKNSPAFVAKHESKIWLHKSVRVLLSGFVGILSPFLRK
jgi:hypothetical protein